MNSKVVYILLFIISHTLKERIIIFFILLDDVIYIILMSCILKIENEMLGEL